jgi:hypothetical protein
MKTCTRCRVAKERDEFGSHKGKGDGLTSRCKACLKLVFAERMQDSAYHARILEIKRQSARLRYATDPEKMLANSWWNNGQRDRALEYARGYARTENGREINRRYRQKSAEKLLAARRRQTAELADNVVAEAIRERIGDGVRIPIDALRPFIEPVRLLMQIRRHLKETSK